MLIKQHWIWYSIGIIVLCLDLSSKSIIKQLLAEQETIAIMPHLNFISCANPGFAFGLFEHIGFWERVLLSFSALFLFLWKFNLSHLQANIIHYYYLSYALVVGGALGNLYERVVQGHVTDFIDFYVGHFHFSTFNLADVAIVIGMFLLVYLPTKKNL